MKPYDECPQPIHKPVKGPQPVAPPIYPSAVYECQSPAEANQLLGGEIEGFVYSRDGHPNAKWLEEKCNKLHHADSGLITGSGMAALSVIALAHLKSDDHIIVSKHLYGRTITLLSSEMERLKVRYSLIDTNDLEAATAACTEKTKLIIVETISNPLLHVSSIQKLATIAHQNNALLVVDNSFAGPIVCRPLELGADIVMESITKIMSGHSDVMLGYVGGTIAACERIQHVSTVYGFTPSPFDCWIALRGISTLAIRTEKTSANALQLAKKLESHSAIDRVCYPGLESSRYYLLASEQFKERRFGSIVTFRIKAGPETADRFIEAAKNIPFSPSLGDVTSTLSHPDSTSHRLIPLEEKQKLGIDAGTIRLSVGIEDEQTIEKWLFEAISIATK